MANLLWGCRRNPLFTQASRCACISKVQPSRWWHGKRVEYIGWRISIRWRCGEMNPRARENTFVGSKRISSFNAMQIRISKEYGFRILNSEIVTPSRYGRDLLVFDWTKKSRFFLIFRFWIKPDFVTYLYKESGFFFKCDTFLVGMVKWNLFFLFVKNFSWLSLFFFAFWHVPPIDNDWNLFHRHGAFA